MRKRLAVMIAVLPLAGGVAACGDTSGSSESDPPVATTPAPSAVASVRPGAPVERTSAPSPSATSRTVTRPPAKQPQVKPSSTPALPPYRPPAVGKPIIPTDPLTPPPPFIGDPEDTDQHVQGGPTHRPRRTR